ncbi:MAG: PEP-CTERM sorting domain-containing protein [Minisyncoccota bacterium]
MLRKIVFPTICLMALAGAAQATPMSSFPVDVQVTPWLAPNAYGSSSFPGAVANQEYALLHGLSSYGTPGTPEYYQAQSNVTSAEAIVTDFPSWRGVADPGTAYGSAFAGEYGNRMHFGLLALGDGTTQFSASDLSFVMWSTDPFGALDYAYIGGYNYSTDLQGILYGADGKLGGCDDTFITSGSSSQLVDALVGRGSGNSFAAYCSPCSTTQQQAAINDAASYPGSPFDFSGMYIIGSGSGFLGLGMGTFHVSSVPEPAPIALLGIGFLAMVVVTKRSQRTPKDQKS